MRLVTAFAAALLTIALGAGPAAASGTWTVTPGGPFSGHGGRTILADTTDNTRIVCRRSVLSGAFKGGTGLNGTGIGSVTGGGKFSVCTGPTPFPFKATLRNLPWQISAVSYRAGVVHGTISGIEIRVVFTACAFTIEGPAAAAAGGTERFSYADGTHTLTLLSAGSGLRFAAVSGCASLVHDGDAAAYTAGYAVSPAEAITRP